MALPRSGPGSGKTNILSKKGKKIMQKITFEKATHTHKNAIFEWLDKPHVREFWDNSPEHREDIEIFMDGRIVKTPYFHNDEDFYYWVGSIDNEPYCLVMTSELIPAKCMEEGSPYVPFLSKTGKTFSLDFMIGNDKHVGKGLGAPTLEAFTKFFSKEIEPETDTYMIDPGQHNPRAQHVYAKAGFKVVGEYTSKSGYFEGGKSDIMTKKISIG